MIDKLKTIGIFILTAIATLFGGYAYVQKKRAEHNAKEIDELEDQMQSNDINNEVKEFQAINTERRDVADEKLDETDNNTNHRLNANSTY